ncbi:MAG TPA: hypothetical protein VF288_10825 [Mycobacteriales bacterium]
MLVHLVDTTTQIRHLVDPERGPVARREEVLGLAPVTSISHGGKTYQRDETGTFDVPQDVADALVGRRLGTAGVFAGPNPLGAPEKPAKARGPRGA